eukprot:1161664-Pelagomonas_calceolata.AAC.16
MAQSHRKRCQTEWPASLLKQEYTCKIKPCTKRHTHWRKVRGSDAKLSNQLLSLDGNAPAETLEYAPGGVHILHVHQLSFIASCQHAHTNAGPHPCNKA